MTYIKEKTEKYSDNLQDFIKNLIEEDNKRLKEIIEENKSLMNEISGKEAIIKSIQKADENNSKLFSPNSKDYDIDEHISKIEKIKDEIKFNLKEQEEIEKRILQFKKIGIILNNEISNINIGLNVLEIQEQDRQRIARDLHDSTVQNLTGLIHKCELCTRLIDIDPVRIRLELNTISNTLKSVINEIREIIYNLKPMSLEDLGLIITIERFINQLMLHHDIKVKFTHNEERNDILPVIKLSIFRMIQEACNNAIKHAEAKCIEIDIQYQKECIKISIKDDGKGFDIENLKDHIPPDYTGYGLSIMKERVYLLSGEMKIQSTANKGTIVTITVPIK